MNFPTGCFFPLCQLQHDCHSVYFPDIIWSNCGRCSAFLICSLTSFPAPLPVLCHAGITLSTLASTPHLTKPSGKYSLPWITHYIAKVQSQRHLIKICFVFFSEQWAVLLKHCLHWAKNMHSTFQAHSQWPCLKELAVWALRGIKLVYMKKQTSFGTYKSCIQHSKHHRKYLSLSLGIRSNEKYYFSLQTGLSDP